MTALTEKTDILICGAGIVGLTLARELVQRGVQDILIIEKESHTGFHASGRNSGVLHAGIYYKPGTVRAQTCIDGNRMMRAYCLEKDIPLDVAGKVIVARTHDEIPALEELYKRATANGADVSLISEEELKKIEPFAKTCTKALYSRETSVTDPKKVLQALQQELLESGKVRILFDTAFTHKENDFVVGTTNGTIKFAQFINCAGAHSDTIAHAFGAGKDYILIPFKGIYKKLRKSSALKVNGSIYPVPDIRNPFLGVHFTKSVYGDIYAGPTAIPAFGRENYRFFDDLSTESIKILAKDVELFFTNSKFRSVAFSEPRKYIPSKFFKDAKELVTELHWRNLEETPKIGIRPQLIDLRTNELVMDFVTEKNNNHLHVLNAISPAFTSSMSFAKVLADIL
ncbi:MAG: L-2-hydroxyglutarate oxidase [Desulfovibrio sp.]